LRDFSEGAVTVIQIPNGTIGTGRALNGCLGRILSGQIFMNSPVRQGHAAYIFSVKINTTSVKTLKIGDVARVLAVPCLIKQGRGIEPFSKDSVIRRCV